MKKFFTILLIMCPFSVFASLACHDLLLTIPQLEWVEIPNGKVISATRSVVHKHNYYDHRFEFIFIGQSKNQGYSTFLVQNKEDGEEVHLTLFFAKPVHKHPLFSTRSSETTLADSTEAIRNLGAQKHLKSPLFKVAFEDLFSGFSPNSFPFNYRFFALPEDMDIILIDNPYIPAEVTYSSSSTTASEKNKRQSNPFDLAVNHPHSTIMVGTNITITVNKDQGTLPSILQGILSHL